MATKYSDFIKIQDFLPVYDITSELPGSWQTFIPTKQFTDLLTKSVSCIVTDDLSKRRSIWVRGTFGTGKSHASSVVKHLLCDPSEDIENYLDSFTDISLKERIKNIRAEKRYFPVVLKGVEGAYSIPRFSLTLQRATKAALSAAGHDDFVVPSDFEVATEWVKKFPSRVSAAIEENEDLRDVASTPEKLLALLSINDSDAFMALEEALEKENTYLNSKSISDWLVEVEAKIREDNIADGLIIFWDEFTSVVDTLKSDRIDVLQTIAEKSKHCNLFLYLISHRVETAVMDLKGKDITRMGDRFENVDYQMDEISTYRILRHTFRVDNTTAYATYNYNTTHKLDSLVDYLCESNTAEEHEHISNLFPLHPFTAYLCSKMSNLLGSANRSVLKFMNDDTIGFKHFINDENTCEQHQLLTADWLWDFFFGEFDKDPQCAIFCNTYSTHLPKVEKMSDRHVKVFKVILLLNALGTRFQKNANPEKLAPNDKNLDYLFAGEMEQDQLKQILDWLDSSKIIARDIFGEFKISVSSYNPQEISKEREKLASQYTMATDFLRYFSAGVPTQIAKIFTVGETGGLFRKCNLQIYSCEESEAVLRSKLKKYTAENPNYLHIVLILSVTDEARDGIENRIKMFSGEFPDTIFILPSEVFTEAYKTDFITALAHATVSQNHQNSESANGFNSKAREYLVTWINRMLGGTYNLYFRETLYTEGIVSQVSSFINKKLSMIVFPNGMESVKALRSETMTYFKNKYYPAVALQILQAQTRDKMLAFGGEFVPSRYIFIDGDNNLIDDTCHLTATALNGESWLVKVCQEVDRIMSEAQQTYQDKFSLCEVLSPLTRPPFGFFSNKANWVALSYALRRYSDNLFLPSTSQPVSDEKLQQMLTSVFKLWDEGGNDVGNKLALRFGSQEERNLTKQLGEIFNLKNVDGVSINDLKSLNYAKWGITEFCKQKAKYPLWTLTYCDSIDEACKGVITDLIALFSQESPSIDKIKKLSHAIDGLNVDLYQLISDYDNFNEGFKNFIHQIDGIEILDEWFDELEEELSHLQSEIAFRSENDIKTRAYQFYINKIKKTEPVDEEVDDNDEEDDNSNPTSPIPTPTTVSEEVVTKARILVREANMPSMLWQKVVLDMLEEKPEVAEFFIKYLGQ